MRLCKEQPANIRVTRRRSDLVSSPHPPPRETEVLTRVVPYQFVFRFDRRWKETELFIRVLHRALDTAPCPYHQLTAERTG